MGHRVMLSSMFRSSPKLSVGAHADWTTSLIYTAQVMLVSEEGINNCVVYLFKDIDEADFHTSNWMLTSRILFDISDTSNLTFLKEIRAWGPPMPHGTIRVAARHCAEALLKTRPTPPREPRAWTGPEVDFDVRTSEVDGLKCTT